MALDEDDFGATAHFGRSQDGCFDVGGGDRSAFTRRQQRCMQHRVSNLAARHRAAR